MTLDHAALSASQQTEALIEATGQLLRVNIVTRAAASSIANAIRSRRRHTCEPNRSDVRVIEREAGPDRPGTVDEEHDHTTARDRSRSAA